IALPLPRDDDRTRQHVEELIPGSQRADHRRPAAPRGLRRLARDALPAFALRVAERAHDRARRDVREDARDTELRHRFNDFLAAISPKEWQRERELDRRLRRRRDSIADARDDALRRDTLDRRTCLAPPRHEARPLARGEATVR